MNRPTVNLLLALGLCLASYAFGQENPVYVDESHVARQVLEQADAVTATNPAEAVRLLQELLDTAGHQVVSVMDAPEPIWFRSVRRLVRDRYLQNPVLLDTMRTTFEGQARILLEDGRLDELLLRLPLTEAGLEATLRLGMGAIERGELHRGRLLLESALESPDLDQDSQRTALYGLGTVATLLEDEPGLELIHRQLDDMGPAGTSTREALDSIRLRVVDDGTRTVTDVGPEASLEELVVQSIWTVPLDQSLFNRREELAGSLGSFGQTDLEGLSSEGWFTTVVPAVRGDTVYVNLGETVLALDALTGNTRWSSTRRQQDLRLDPTERPASADFMALQDRYLVTATGHLYAAERSGTGHLLCFDAITGSIRWGLQVDGHPAIEQSDGLYICSPPVIHEGTVFVLARKISPQQLTSDVLVAIDLVEGEIDWARWISSTGRMRRNIVTNTMAPTAHDGRIHVATGTGAVASIDAADGDLLWVQRLTPPSLTTSPSGANRPYTHHQPVLVEAGLVCIAPDGDEVLVLDPDTGSIRRADPATNPDRWNHPVYLIAAGDDLISIGRDVRCFDGGDLDALRWVLDVGDDASSIPTGRVQALDHSLIVPMRDRILQVDRRTGTITRELPVDRSGNVLVAGPQLLVASANELDAFTAFDRARDLLAGRIVDEPESIDARLDLVRLAARAQQTDLLNSSIRDLLDRLPDEEADRSEQVRDRLMVHLVDAIRSEPEFEDQQGGTLLSLLMETADRPHRELEAILVLGDRQFESDPAAAADTWRRILRSEAISRSWHEESDLHAPGATWAHRRLAALDVPGDPIDEWPWREPADPSSIDDVIASMRDNLRTTRTPGRLAAVLPDTIERIAEADRTEAAIGLLNAWRLRYPDELIAAGAGRSPDEWIRSLSPSVGRDVLDDGLLPDPGRVSGTLLPHADGSLIDPSPTNVLVQWKDRLRCIDPSRSEAVWDTPGAGGESTLLLHDDEQVCVLVDQGDMQPELLVLDAGTGEPRTDPIDLFTLLPDMDSAGSGHQHILPDGRMIEPGELLICSNDESITLIRRDGQLAGLAGPLFDAPAWTRRLPLRVVHGFLPTPTGFVVIGPDIDADEPLAVSNSNPALYHVEHATGDFRKLTWPEQAGRFAWIARSPLNDLLLGGDDGVACIGWPDHTPRWISTAPTARRTRQGWATSEVAVLLGGDENEFHLVDLLAGEPVGTLEQPSYRGTGTIRDMQFDGNGFRILRDSGLAVHDPEGTLIGTDGIPREYEYEHLLTDGNRHVLLAHRQSISDLEGGPRRSGRRHLYRISMLDETGRVLDLLDLYPLRSRIRAVRLRGPTLLIETDDAVDIITLPPVGAD